MIRNKKGFVVEGLTLLWLGIALVIGTVAVLRGPDIMKAGGQLIHGGSDKNQQKSVREFDVSYPVLYKASIDKDGNATYKPAGNFKQREKTVNVSSEQPKETWWEKFWHLGAMAVVIIIVIFILISTPIGKGIWNVYVRPQFKKLQTALEEKEAALAEKEAALQAEKEQHEELLGEAKIIVRSIDKGLGVWNDSIKLAEVARDAAAEPQKSINAAVTKALTDGKRAFLDKLLIVQNDSTKQLVDAIQEELKND